MEMQTSAGGLGKAFGRDYTFEEVRDLLEEARVTPLDIRNTNMADAEAEVYAQAGGDVKVLEP